MSSKDYKGAIKAYTAALRLSPKGPSSHIYYANRSAAYCYIERYAEAEMDAERSVKTGDGPAYAKGFNRLGYCRYMLEDYSGGAEAYETSLRLDPSNANSKDFLKKCQDKGGKGGALSAGAAPAAAAGAGANPLAGVPGMEGMHMNALASRMGAAGGAGAGGLGGLLNNPAMMQMAQQMMSNPDALAQAQ
jgi:small glutamine-rich tetratricopeptide repeat-containing protein alpha